MPICGQSLGLGDGMLWWLGLSLLSSQGEAHGVKGGKVPLWKLHASLTWRFWRVSGRGETATRARAGIWQGGRQ